VTRARAAGAIGLCALALSCDAGRGGIRPSGPASPCPGLSCDNRVTLLAPFSTALSESELRMLAIRFCRNELCVDIRPDPTTLDCSTDGPLRLDCAILAPAPPALPTLRLTLYGLAQDFVDGDRYQVRVLLGSETQPRIAIDQTVTYVRETATAPGCEVSCSVAALSP